MASSDLVPETAIDYDEVFRRGGRNLGDEDFALFKCPSCGRVYLIDYEVATIYLDAEDLSKRADADPGSIRCTECRYEFRADEPIIGPEAHRKFGVTWSDLSVSPWSWIARPPDGG
jgi:rubredoxin